ncbi:MAG: alkaline phosphatase family protein, partial [Bacteroidota bacterium]|nr:alkaline phosphatase family protein [Bacteroidota bacterium]
MIHFFSRLTSFQHKKGVLFCFGLFLSLFLFGQPNMGETKRPKLVVGIVVDQMRWDFLYRYANRYGNDGFKRLLREGFSCENTMIPYTPTITACGHTCVYTGSVPAVHGIVGNNWYSRELNRTVYCTDDTTEKTVGSASAEGEMSPRNMLTTTIGDELKLATNFRSKVVGIAIKDRGAILPAGHAANATYWYDGTVGKFISSTYYMDSLPGWVNRFNEQGLPSQYMQKGWQTLYPVNTYTQSTPDEESYEGRFSNESSSSFPHALKGSAKAPFEILASSPFGNTYTLEFAKTVIQNDHLGSNGVTDMLCVSISSTDYVGHQFGPNSVEAEDTYLRLDKDLALFFQYLDKTIGKNEYTVFLTADHGAINAHGFLEEHKLPGGSFNEKTVKTKLDSLLQSQGISKGII